MLKRAFSLKPKGDGSLSTMDMPETLSFLLKDMQVVVQEGAYVTIGSLLAEHPAPDMGNLYAPQAGQITRVGDASLSMRVAATSSPIGASTGIADEPASPGKISLTGLSQDALCRVLKNLGVDVRNLRSLLTGADTLILTGLEPEPGMGQVAVLLEHCRSTLQAGFAVLQALFPIASVVLVVPKGSSAQLEGIALMPLTVKYPHNLPPLLTKKVTKHEMPPGVAVLPVHFLYALGMVAEQGVPQQDTVISLAGRVFRVLLGTPVQDILHAAEIAPQQGDIVVRGGIFTGQAMATYTDGVDKNDTSFCFIPAKKIPVYGEGSAITPCIDCGLCVRECPVFLRPNTISRYVEKQQIDRCAKESVQVCMECGLCSYYCVSQRPMLQLLTEAKKGLIQSAVATARPVADAEVEKI